ncbi:MAG: protoporphyrinogen oxidase [Bacteroidetes bacterium]|nr:protoporphyrinogen oxidase [Bacteroidota bacterium]
MKQTEPYDAIIVGAGISGLVTAWLLHQKGKKVLVLEKNAQVGGTMKTVHEDGWLIETGPNSALETTPLFKTLFRDLDLGEELVYANSLAQNRYILRHGRLHALPLSPQKLITSRLWSVPGKLRILREPFIGRGKGEETIAQFVRRRLGRELLDYAINPFVAGVYAGDPAKLSVQAAFPKLYALEEKYGSLIKGQIRGAKDRKKRGEVSKDRAQLFSFQKGMQTLPSRISERMPGAIHLDTHVKFITRTREGYEVHVEKAGDLWSVNTPVLVLSVPAGSAANLIAEFEPSLAKVLREIYYPPVAEVFLGFKAAAVKRTLDGFGFLVPEKESRCILGTIWSSTLFTNRAPKDHVSLTAFVGGSRQPNLAILEDSELVRMVTTELEEILGVSSKPVFERVTKWKQAIPQYELGHLSKVARMEDFEQRHPGLYLRGNYRGGIAVGDCVMQSARTAEEIMNRDTPSRTHKSMEAVV